MSYADDARISRGMGLLLGAWRGRLASGERHIGWKMGYGAPAARERLGITAPLVGFLTDAALVAPGATVPLAGWGKPLAEPEIALYLGKDIPGGASCDTVRAAISAVGPAFELVDVGVRSTDVAEILAGNISHRRVVLGGRDTSRAGGVLKGLTGRVFRNGVEEAVSDDPGGANGDMIDNVRLMADTLADFGEMLRAGEVIITGSIVPAPAVGAGDEIVFQLEPIGNLSVRFA